MLNKFVFLVSFLSILSSVSSEKLRFAAGSEKGTYFAIGKSLNKLPKTKVKVLKTAGSIENIDLIANGKADIGLAQLDVFTDSKMIDEKIRGKVKFVLPIYREEIHIITMNQERKKQGLKGLLESSIYVGPKNSGTAATADIIFSALKIKDKIEFINAPTDQGVESLLAGQGEYAMLVGGAPLKVISYHGDRFNLVQFDRATQVFFTSGNYPYKKTRLEQGIYDWLEEDIATISIASVIIARKDADPKKIKKLIKNIYKKRKKLRRSHPKWEELDIEYAKYILKSYPQFAFKGAYKAVKKLKSRKR